MGPRVVRLPLAVERVEVRGCATLQHRPLAAAPGPREELLDLAPKPDDGPQRAQRVHPALATGQAAARRDDLAGLEAQRLQRLGLQTAKGLLAVVAKDVRDGAAVAGRDHVVGLDEATAEAACQQASTDRLPGSHEADEDDVVRHRPHPTI